MRRRTEEPNSEAGKTAPGLYRVDLSKASARDSTKECNRNKKPLGSRDAVRGALPILRSQSVASALDLRSGATPCGSASDYNKENKTHTSGYFFT